MKMRATVGDQLTPPFVGNIKYENKQDVRFLYVIEQPAVTNNNLSLVQGDTVDESTKIIGRSINYVPQKYAYTGTTQNNGVSLVSVFGKQGLIYMNYNQGGRISDEIYNYQQYGMMTVPRSDYVNAISIYKKEIWYDESQLDERGNPLAVEENNYHLSLTPR